MRSYHPSCHSSIARYWPPLLLLATAHTLLLLVLDGPTIHVTVRVNDHSEPELLRRKHVRQPIPTAIDGPEDTSDSITKSTLQFGVLSSGAAGIQPPALPHKADRLIHLNSVLRNITVDYDDEHQAVSIRRKRKGDGYQRTGGVLPSNDQNRAVTADVATWAAVDNGTCMDHNAHDSPAEPWQVRAPHAILLGTMKGGTHAVMEYLWDHPFVARHVRNGQEIHFFDRDEFYRNASGIPQRQNQIAYANKFLNGYPDFPENDNLYAIDDTPRYLLWSDRTPDAILCVAPWAKLFAVLRDPIERAESQFRFQDEARRRADKPMVDWEVWIDDDIRQLTEAGVVRDWNVVDFDSFAGSDDEMLAWKRYLRQPNSNLIVGRGLYAIQLEHYFAALEKAGRPRSDLFVLRSEELRNSTQQVYDRLLDFLELPPHQLLDTSPRHETKDEAEPMPDHVRRKLEDLYRPYNRRLYDLLGWEHGFDY